MLQHVSLEVSSEDLGEAVRCLELLGFEEVDVPETIDSETRWLEHGGTQIHLLVVDNPTVPPEGHAAIVVEDFEEACARLIEAGVDVDPRRAHWGSLRAFASMPGGHRIELMADPPSS